QIRLALLCVGVLHLSSGLAQGNDAVCQTADDTQNHEVIKALAEGGECATIKDAVNGCCLDRQQCIARLAKHGTVTHTDFTECGKTQWNCINDQVSDMDRCRAVLNHVTGYGLSRANPAKGYFLVLKEMGITNYMYGNCSNAMPAIDACARTFEKCKEGDEKRKESGLEANYCGNEGKMCFDRVIDIDKRYSCAHRVGYVVAMLQKHWSEQEEEEPDYDPFDAIHKYCSKKWGWSWWVTLLVLLFVCVLAMSAFCACCYCCAVTGLERQKEARRQLKSQKRDQKKHQQKKSRSRESSRRQPPSSVRSSQESSEV
ncbi:hypothetical protein PFISCL1PPCAC_7871, partial [Pristionchus fissidentatus]